MTNSKSKNVITKLSKYYGEVRAELKFFGLYELTIAVVLSAQTTDRQVNSVTPELFGRYPDFTELSLASISDVEKIIKSVGLYKTKARNIINLSREVVTKYNNILPDKFAELTKLPGIGRKSANVILSIGYNKPALAVDTHVLRVANRIGYVKSSDPVKVEYALINFIPESDWIVSHLLFIRHGRKICLARKPLCTECPVFKLCDFVNV